MALRTNGLEQDREGPMRLSGLGMFDDVFQPRHGSQQAQHYP